MAQKSFFKSRTKLVCTVSILINILLLGMIAGHYYYKWSHHPWQSVKKDLSPESRNIVGRTFQSAFRDIRPLGDEARKARAELIKILSAEEFDEAAFDKTVAEIVDVRREMTAIKIQATKDAAMNLSAEERKKMADRMAKMVGGGHEKRVKRDREPRMMNFKPEHKPEIDSEAEPEPEIQDEP